VNVPSAWKGKRVEFFSEGANYRTTVYVNGQLAGEHDGGYTPFAIPIDKYVKFGETNVIAVVCDNVSKSDRAPGGMFGWWCMGGLYRDVSIRMTDKTWIDDVTVVTDVDGNHVAVSIGAVVRSENGASSRTVSAVLVDPTGSPVYLPADVASTIVSFKDGEALATMKFDLQDALLWSPDDPNLYTLKLLLEDDGKQTDEWSHRIGMRTIKVDGRRLLLNGEPLLVKGLNRHEQYGDACSATHDSVTLAQDLDLVEWLGANALRSHYPNHRELYELCDERGILNMVEVPLWQWGRPLCETDDPGMLESARMQLHEMVCTYKNHACVFMWSISNENLTKIKNDNPDDIAVAKMTIEGNIQMVRLAKELDSTRPVVEVSNEWPDDPVHEHTDLSTVNVYVGSPKPPLAPYVDQVYKFTHEKLDKLRAQVPDKPIIVSEFGKWTVPGLATSYPPGETFQAAKLTCEWTRFLEEENFVGGFVWCFADYDLHKQWKWAHEIRCAYGLFDVERKPKDAAFKLRELWTK